MELRYAIVFVTDLERSVTFYRDVLGLRVTMEASGWTELATGETTLALHATTSSPTQTLSTHTPPGRCRLCFWVDDLDVVHRNLVAREVTCLQRPRVEFGHQLAIYADPDGCPFSIGAQRNA
jgi:lactoylglutathione lyase